MCVCVCVCMCVLGRPDKVQGDVCMLCVFLSFLPKGDANVFIQV